MLKKLFDFKFVKDSIYTLISFIIFALSGIITNVIIGNTYGSAELGIFNQALALLMIFSLISILGLNISSIKYVSQFKDSPTQQKEIFSSASYMAVCLSVIICLLLYFLITMFPAVFFNKEVTHATAIVLLCLPLFSQNKIYMALMNGLRHMKVYAFVQSARWLLIIGFIACAVFLNKSIYFVCYCFLFSEICIWIVCSILYGKYFTLRFSSKLWFKNNLVFGSKSVLIGFLGETNNKIDIFFISFFLSNHYVGIYSFASTIVKGFLSISSVIQLNINPIISDLWAKKDSEAIKKYTLRISKMMLFIMTPILIIASIAYPIFINTFMTDPVYQASIPIFYILLTGIFLPSVYYFSGAYLTMANLLNITLRNMLIIIIYNALSCFVFINLLGFIGASVSTATTYIFSVFFSHYYIKKRMGIKLIQIKNPFKKYKKQITAN